MKMWMGRFIIPHPIGATERMQGLIGAIGVTGEDGRERDIGRWK
jgi:hypothetical protein